MKYSVLTEEMRSDLMLQRIAAHEKAYFELEVQLAEIRAVIPTLKDEDLERAANVETTITGQMAEILTRIDAVRIKRSAEPSEPTEQQEASTENSNVKSLRRAPRKQR